MQYYSVMAETFVYMRFYDVVFQIYKAHGRVLPDCSVCPDLSQLNVSMYQMQNSVRNHVIY